MYSLRYLTNNLICNFIFTGLLHSLSTAHPSTSAINMCSTLLEGGIAGVEGYRGMGQREVSTVRSPLSVLKPYRIYVAHPRRRSQLHHPHSDDQRPTTAPSLPTSRRRSKLRAGSAYVRATLLRVLYRAGAVFGESIQSLLAFILLIKCFPRAPNRHRAYAHERRSSHIMYALSTAASAPTTSSQSPRADFLWPEAAYLVSTRLHFRVQTANELVLPQIRSISIQHRPSPIERGPYAGVQYARAQHPHPFKPDGARHAGYTT